MPDTTLMESATRFESAGLMSLRFNIFNCAEAHEYSTDAIPYNRFAYVRNGCADFFTGETEGWLAASAVPGNVVYIPAKRSYHSKWSRDSSIFVVDLYVKDACADALNQNDDIRVLFSDGRDILDEPIERLQRNTRAEESYMWMERVSVVMQILCEIARANEEENACRDLVNKSILYLNNNFEKDTPVEQLAQMCAFSVSHFRRLFKKCCHMSPVEYRNALRVRHADELIRRGGCTVARAAEMVGIYDAKYFTKLYKKYTGETPRQTKQATAGAN